MEQAQQRKYTVDKYMALEAQGGVRHKFFEGEVFAMSGGMAKHNTLVLNCAFAMRTGLRGGTCRVFTKNVQLTVESRRYYNYPDVQVTCAPADLSAERTTKSAILVMKVLSKSTATRDRRWKFNQYKQLPSLKHYANDRSVRLGRPGLPE